MKKLSVTLFLIIIGMSSLNARGWHVDFTEAKAEAAKKNRNIVLVFEGSDWCAPCIRLNSKILNTEEFMAYAKDHFVLLKADFPRKRKNSLDQEQQEKNIKLAEIYDKQGYFPLVVVLDKNGKVLGETGYKKVTPGEYIKLLNSFATTGHAGQIYKRTLKLMGSRFEITVVAKDSAKAGSYIDLAVNEITRIDKLISSWDANSQTSEINRNAGIQPVKVDKELYELVERAIGISKLTDGAFDMSYAAMDNVWKFDGSITTMPAEAEIKSLLEKVGYQNIILDKEKQTVFLKLKGMKIGFGAIGKGYAADKAKQLLIAKGVVAGIINASGDMNTWGKRPNGEDWTVAITNPFNKKNACALLPISDGAVVTSGNYEKYIILEGKRYSHIIDPRTGRPARGIVSATVFAPKAELADALATSIFVMGVDVGLDRINQLPKVECVIIDEQGNIHSSKNIKLEQQQ